MFGKLRLLLLVLPFVALGQTASRPFLSGRLAYVNGDALYLQTLSDGRSLEISRFVYSLAWSPSGDWLSYRFSRPKGTKSFVVRFVGQRIGPLLSLQSDTSPRWSPRDDLIAYSYGGTLSLFRPALRQSDEKVLFSVDAPATISDFCWSADGSRLAVLESNGDVTHLWIVRTDGVKEAVAVRLEDPLTSLSGATLTGWTSDDHAILLWPNPDHSASLAMDGLPLVSVSLSDGVPEHLVNDDVLVNSDFISISSRRPEVLVTVGGDRQAWTHKRLAIASAAAGKATLLTDPRSAVASVAWSPDGQRFAYISGPDGGSVGGGDQARKAMSQRRLWIADDSGASPRQLTNDMQFRDEYPMWSKDGKTIVFTRLDAQSNVSVWSVDATTGTLLKIVDSIIGDSRIWFSTYGHIDWDNFVAWSRE